MQHAVKAGMVSVLICCASCWHAWGVQVSRSRVNQQGGDTTLTLDKLGDGAQFVVVATQQDNAGAIARVGQGRCTTNPSLAPVRMMRSFSK